jgi:ABC transporter related
VEEFLLIKVCNVTKRYNKNDVIKSMNFEVKENEIVGFLGPNGAGKTTTMNMITGYIEPTEGQIYVNGYDIQKQPKQAKKQIGYMSENSALYPDFTVKEFITYLADLKRVDKKEKNIEIDKVINQTGLSSVENKLISNLSRGYKQRVSLAGALVGNPKVLILDEPTVGLDPKQIADIRKLIKALGKKHTILMSTHILPEVSSICSRIIIINKGEIIAEDTPENIENMALTKNSVLVTVEDPDNKIEKIQSKLQSIREIKKIKVNEDNTILYEIIAENSETDIRKQIFDIFPKEDITIFELRKSETTLEDAFLKLISKKGKKSGGNK